jgi:hypothetical protein
MTMPSSDLYNSMRHFINEAGFAAWVGDDVIQARIQRRRAAESAVTPQVIVPAE